MPCRHSSCDVIGDICVIFRVFFPSCSRFSSVCLSAIFNAVKRLSWNDTQRYRYPHAIWLALHLSCLRFFFFFFSTLFPMWWNRIEKKFTVTYFRLVCFLFLHFYFNVYLIRLCQKHTKKRWVIIPANKYFLLSLMEVDILNNLMRSWFQICMQKTFCAYVFLF